MPPPRDHLRVEKDGRLINIAAPQVPDRNYTPGGQIAQVIEPTHEQEMSIKKFQVRRDKPHLIRFLSLSYSITLTVNFQGVTLIFIDCVCVPIWKICPSPPHLLWGFVTYIIEYKSTECFFVYSRFIPTCPHYQGIIIVPMNEFTHTNLTIYLRAYD